MIPIKDLINKIKWDERENPEEYVLMYLDLDRETELPYAAIERLEGNFMIIMRNGEEVEIPLHRIRAVKKQGKIVWERTTEK